MTLGSKDIGIRKSEFVARTQFLCNVHGFKVLKISAKVLESFANNFLGMKSQQLVLYIYGSKTVQYV